MTVLAPMRVRLDGHRLTDSEIAHLLARLGMTGLAEQLAADGYKLQPARAPRRIPHNRATFRLCWTLRDQDSVLTVRTTGTINARPLP